MNYTPAGHLVMIKRDDIMKQTASGIYIAADERLEKAAMNRGTVLGLGPTCWCADWLGGGKTPWCKVGDKVCFAKYAGTTYVDEETKEEFLLIRDEDVLMVIEE